MELEDMVNMVIKNENQLRWRGGNTRLQQQGSSSSWKLNFVKEEKPAPLKPRPEPKQGTDSERIQDKSDPSNTQNCDIKGFKCQGRGYIASQRANKHVMILHDDDEFDTEDEGIEDDPIPPLEDA